MINGSVFLRVAVLLVIAMALTGLARYYFSQDGGLPATPAAPTSPPQPAEPAPAPRTEAPAPRAPQAAPGETSGPAGPTANLTPPPAPVPPPIREAPPALEPQGNPAAEASDENAGARAVDLLDLNTASVAQLNGLKGGGSIGRAIVQHRPYASVDQLLSKRVLSKTTYQRIKDQVTVR